jgi:ABC-2 type transport system ATP-binding protein
MRGKLAAGVLAAILVCVPAAQARDVTVTSFDGTKISAHFFPGKGASAANPAPTILVGPGWSMPADTNTDSDSGAGSLFGVPGISTFIKSGYNVLTWDPRGFGQSGGTVEIDDPNYEGRDVKALVDFVSRQPEALLDKGCSTTKAKRKGKRHTRQLKRKRKRRGRQVCGTKPGDPRVGMAGGSYGGGIQLVSAAIDPRIDAIEPTIAWHSLLTSIFPEGNIKLGWGSILVAAGVQGSAQGGGQNPATAAGRQDPHFYSIVTNGAATGMTSQDDLNWMAGHGPADLVKQIKIPTLLVQGTVDTLFPLDEAVTNFKTIEQNRTSAARAGKRVKKHGKRGKRRRRGGSYQVPVPVKMIWFCGGHGACFTNSGPSDYLIQREVAWFDRYLKDKTDVNTGPTFAWIADDGQVRSSDAYPLRSAGSLNASGSGVLPIAPGQGSGGLIFASQSPVGVNVPIPGPSADANVLGAPHVDLTYQGNASPQHTWVYGQIVNPRNGLVLGNLATPIPLTLDGQPHTISRDLEMVAARAPAGGGYTLQLIPSSTLYDMQRATGAVNFSSIGVSLPLGEPAQATAPSAKQKKKKRHKKRHHR